MDTLLKKIEDGVIFENERFEFKSLNTIDFDSNDQKKVTEWLNNLYNDMCAFANNKGGAIIIGGLVDVGDLKPFNENGLKLFKIFLHNIKINQKLDSTKGITISTTQDTYDDAKFIVITIEKNATDIKNTPFTRNRKIYYRQSKASVEVDDDLFQLLKKNTTFIYQQKGNKIFTYPLNSYKNGDKFSFYLLGKQHTDKSAVAVIILAENKIPEVDNCLDKKLKIFNLICLAAWTEEDW